MIYSTAFAAVMAACAVASPSPRICCQAETAGCKACAAAVTIDEYCATNPSTQGCPVECGDGSELFCKSFVQCFGEEDYPLVVDGCFTSECVNKFTCELSAVKPPFPGSTEPDPPATRCCQAETAGCKACAANVSVFDYCAYHGPSIPGCGTSSDANSVTALPGNGVPSIQPELPCTICTLAIPQCETGCDNCEISQQACTECSKATCKDS